MKKKSFAHTGCQCKSCWASQRLCEAVCVRTVLFVGKCGFRIRRFNKGSRALATRAKTHCLDQNQQSLDYIAHSSNNCNTYFVLFSRSSGCTSNVFFCFEVSPRFQVELSVGWIHLALFVARYGGTHWWASCLN